MTSNFRQWFDEQVEREKQQQAAAASIAVSSARAMNPDERAQDIAMGNIFGAPADMVAAERPTFQARLADMQASTVLQSSPMLASWLRLDGENARLAHDDLPSLSWWDKAMIGSSALVSGAYGTDISPEGPIKIGRFVSDGIPNALTRSVQRVELMADNLMAESSLRRVYDRNASFGEIFNQEAAEAKKQNVRGVAGAVLSLKALFDSGIRFAGPRLFGSSEDDARDKLAAVKDVSDRIAATPMSPLADEFKRKAMDGADVSDFGKTASKIYDAFKENPIGGLMFGMETALESMPQLASVLAVSAITKSPVQGALMMGRASYATERYTALSEFLREKNIDLGKPDDVRKILNDPAILKEASDRGVVRGAVIGTLDTLSFGLAGVQMSKSILGEAMVQSVVQAISGSAGEALAQLASGQQINWQEIFGEALGSIGTAPVEMSAAGNAHMKKVNEAAASLARVDFFNTLAGKASESKLRARMPEKFRDYLSKVTENGPVENLYVPADRFTQYFQSLGVDPADVLAEFPSVTQDEYRAALATGGDIRIPTAEYAAHMAGSEHDAFMVQNMRLKPDQMTAQEAAEFNAKAQEALQQAYDEAERLRVEEEARRPFEAEIYDTMVSRLREAGRATEVARAEAALYPAFYRAMAERTGNAIDDLMRMFPLPQVRADALPDAARRNPDTLGRMLGELRSKEWRDGNDRKTFGPSLTDFVAGFGVDPKDVQSGDVRAILDKDSYRFLMEEYTSQKPGEEPVTKKRPARREIVREGGLPLDEIARRAVESGYMSGHPEVLAWKQAQIDGSVDPDLIVALLESLANDVRVKGGAEFADAQENADLAVRRDELRALEETLSRAGAELTESDDAIRAKLDAYYKAEGEALNQSGQSPRGMIQFPAEGIGKGDTIVTLFRDADLSTVIHETGHYFLTMFEALAKAEGAGDALRSDFGALQDWFFESSKEVARDGVVGTGAALSAGEVETFLRDGTTGDAAKDRAAQVGMQERFAKAFETYAMSGRSPSQNLRGVFEKFRAWLLAVYRRLTGLEVPISDELRAVFDRMLATDDEIAKARTDVLADPMTFQSADAMGVDPATFAEFVKLHEAARDEAAAKLLADTMAPLKREQERWYKRQLANVRDEVAVEVNRLPVYRAIEWMGNRRWLGDGAQPEAMPDIRLSKDDLVDRYGVGVLSTLPRGLQTVYAAEGGMAVDEAAGWFGFRSGDEMVRAMEQAPRRMDRIKADADQVMRERYGDVLNDGSVQEAALEAVHGSKRGQLLEAELTALTALHGGPAPLKWQEARELARRTIAGMKVRDAMRPERFLAAERRAAERVAELMAMNARDKLRADASRREVANEVRGAVREGDASGAVAINANIDAANRRTDRANESGAAIVDAKRKQLMNFMLYNEARKVQGEVEAAENLASRLGKESTRKRLAGDYLEAIDEILDSYDFRKISATKEARRDALNAYLARMQAEGRANEIAIPERVIQEAQRIPYKTLTVEYLRGVVDSLKNIEHTARLKKKLIDAKNQRDLDATAESIVAAFNANVPRNPPGRVATAGEGRAAGVRRYFNLILNATTLLREIDGRKDFGDAYRNIKAPVDDASATIAAERAKAADALEKLYEVYSPNERRAMANREHVPEIDGPLSKWERIAVALNTGNEGNLQRLTDPNAPGAFTMEQLQAILAPLDKRDWDFVQSVWDYLDTFRPAMEAREKRLTGVAPEWVEPRAVQTPHGMYRGGYYPLVYDPRLSRLVRDEQTVDIGQAVMGGRFSKAQTRNGHLQERAASSGRPVLIDMAVLHRHVGTVIHDLHMSEPVANAWKILQDGRVRDAFIEHGRQVDFETLELWLKDVAEGEVKAAAGAGALMRHFKSNFTAAKLAFNLVTVAMQITGLAQGVVVTGKRNMAKGIIEMARRGPLEVADEIRAKSAFMDTRFTTINKDIADFYQDSKSGPVASRWNEFRSKVMGPLSFWLFTKVQFHAVDVPTWIAGYNEGMSRFGNDETKAIAFADDWVKRAHGSSLFSDRSAFERGTLSANTRQSEFVRLFTALGSYMFTKFNVAYERTQRLRGEVDGVNPQSAKAVLSYTLDLALLFVLEAMLTAALRGTLPKDDGSEDEAKKWAKFIAKETAGSVMGTLPFIRDAWSAVGGFTAGGAYGSITKDIAAPLIQGWQGEVDKAFVKSVINGAGIAVGLPATQINRAVDAGWRQMEGEDVSPLEYIRGKPKP